MDQISRNGGVRHFKHHFVYLVCFIVALLLLAARADCETMIDPLSGFPREPVHVASWPDGKKVAVCFIFYVEHWGLAHGPNFRPDMNGRQPDFTDESFRQYAIESGVPRTVHLFSEQKVPLSVALSSQFPEKHLEIWQNIRAMMPSAAVIAHGLNNSTDMLPLDSGLSGQEAYIHKTLDSIEKTTGVKSNGWSSPSVYANAETLRATAACGLKYTLDGLYADSLYKLMTPAGPLVLIPYPATAVDMGQFLVRNKAPSDLEHLWIDYVSELVKEAQDDTSKEATIVAIGIHPFVVGTPDGARALRRVLENFKSQKLIWMTDTDAVMKVIDKQTVSSQLK